MQKKKILNIISFISIVLIFHYYKMFSRDNISFYLLLFLLYFLFKNTSDLKSTKLVNNFAILFTILLTFGNPDMLYISNWFYITVSIIGLYSLFQRIFNLIRINIKKIEINNKPISKKQIHKTKFIIITMIIGLFCYLPYLLKFFPGLMSSDSYNQVLQIRNVIPYSNSHPLIHTIIIKIMYSCGYFLFKKEVYAVAFYTVFQMITLSYIYSNILYLLYKNNIKRWIIILFGIFFFMYPINALYSITIWKDILFSAIVFWFSVWLWNHYNEKHEWNIKNKIVFTIFSIIICIFRSNALVAYIIFILVLFILYRVEFKKLMKSIIIVLIVSLFIKVPLMKILNVTQPDFVESLSIPLQQVAYVIRNDGEISPKQMKELEKIADIDLIKSQKDVWRAQFVSDYVKDNIRANDKKHILEKNKFKYLKLWVKIGIQNPNKYLRAWIKQTNGFWYYNVDPYTVYILVTQTSGKENFYLGFEQQNFLPKRVSDAISKFIEITTNIYYDVCSPAVGLYFVLISLFVVLEKKKNIMYCIFPIAIVLTLLIATPVSCEFRYVYSLFLGGGVFLILALNNSQEKNSKKKKIHN